MVHQGDIGWWSNSAGDVTGRACLFDDSIPFDANGNFTHYMDGSTWVENWQDGGDRCATPVSPRRWFIYIYLHRYTINGNRCGAHIGLAKATNQGELVLVTHPLCRLLELTKFHLEQMEKIADINFGGGWWNQSGVQAEIPSSAIMLHLL